MALPFVLHMLGVYYAMLVTTYVSNDDDDIMCSDGQGCVENECSADAADCGLARLIARVSVAEG